jgi:hypothetical protein
MGIPKGYEYKKEYERILVKIVSVNPHIRYSAFHREAFKETGAWNHRTHNKSRGISKSTFKEYLSRLPIKKDGSGGYVLDPKVEEILLPHASSEKRSKLRERVAGSMPSDPWKRQSSEDWRRTIQDLILHAVIMYVAGLNILGETNDEAKARELFEWRMKFGVEPWLNEAAAIAWKNRKEIRKVWDWQKALNKISVSIF